ncbi:MAG: flagellar assembly protein FliX [Alphaproteobacteria bacterium]
MVKIESTRPGSTSSIKKAKGKASTSSFSASVGGASSADAPSMTSPVSATQAMVMLQEVDAITLASERGKKLLNYLQALQLQLFDDEVNSKTLHDLALMARDKIDDCQDPALQDILERIEQRVCVELAKRQMI